METRQLVEAGGNFIGRPINGVLNGHVARSLSNTGALYRLVCCLSVLILSVLLFGGIQSNAQAVTADVVGTVTDNNGALLPGAKITIVNADTQLTRTTVSGSAGEYSFTLLPPGAYTVRVTLTGFKAKEVRSVKIGAGDRAREDAQLEIGAATETVTVTGESAAALQTDSSTVQDVVSEQTVQDMPLNGRNLAGAVQLAAGVNQASPSSISSGARADDRRPGFSFAANGQSDLSNNSLVDGLDNNEREQGFAGIRPSLDAISEVRVLTNNYAAEVGRTAGAVVNIITKAGTNGYHGSAYEYFRNDIFDAKDFFTSAGSKTPEYRQNVFGGTLGGPIRKNKTFFFGDVEANRTIQGMVSTSTVPTAAEELNPGDFSDRGGVVVPANKINATGLAYFKMYPTPTNSKLINNYVGQLNKTQNAVSTDDRIDHQFGRNDTMFVRFGYNPTTTYFPGTLPNTTFQGTTINPGGATFFGPSKTVATNFQANYIHIFSPNLVLELKAGYTRINIKSDSANHGLSLASKLGLIDTYTGADATGLPRMWMLAGDYASLGDGIYMPIYDTNNTFQYNGALTYSRGSHNFKAGGAMIRRQLNYFQDQFNPQGGFIFEPTGSYHNSLANLLAGNPLFSERGIDLAHQGLRSWEPSLYGQDDWHAKPWLTLNIGLRWEAYTPITDSHDKFANFDVQKLKILVAGQGTNASGGVKTDYSDISPRVGAEINLGHGTVVRGGFGFSYYPPIMQTQVENTNAPFSYLCFPCFSAAFPNLPVPSSDASNPTGTVSAIDPNLKNAYVRQFNLFVQKQMGPNSFSIGAVGENGRRALYLRNDDMPLPSGVGNPKPTYVYATQLPNVTNIQFIDNSGVSNYYGFQAEFRRSSTKGLTFNGNYTWGHGLSNSVQAASTFTNPSPALVTNNPMYDYGNSPLDVRHRVAGSLSYELPFGKTAHGMEAAAISGWQGNLMGFWQTGLPFTVVDGTAAINLPGITSDRPNQNGSAALSNPSIGKWFNTSVFSTQAVGTPGNEHSDSVYGPRVRVVNASLLKDFTVVDSLRLQFRAEFFNITNTPNFGQPGNGLTTGQFGVVSATAGNMTPREMQFALKLHF
ncbi:MAG: TonB-dependent receptor [Terracidiphilus sp.]|nr:TonB-dependent receptor [Terracidiphilus sp.]